jgi:parallel beta-helix repeat protein
MKGLFDAPAAHPSPDRAAGGLGRRVPNKPEMAKRPPRTSAAVVAVAALVMGLLPATASAGRRARIVVPRDYRSISEAVRHAPEGALVLVRPGVYRESVSVQTSGITIRGVDRFRTVLDGNGQNDNGIIVYGTTGVSVENLTVRNYRSNGVYFDDSENYRMTRIDAIKNGIYGLYAFNSYKGEITDSFAWGSGDAGLYIGECLGCKAVVRNVHAEWNLIGYSGTNATGVEIRDSVFRNNAVGIMPNTLPLEGDSPNRGTLIHDNLIVDNNNERIRPASIWTEVGVPTGTGVWLFGVSGNVVRDNEIEDQDRYGVLLSAGPDPNGAPMDDTVVDNTLTGSGYALAWDGSGANNCFAGNRFEGETGPPEIETLYPCDRPTVGVAYPPVQADVAAALASGRLRDGEEAPNPKRPRCQAHRPRCRRR